MMDGGTLPFTDEIIGPVMVYLGCVFSIVFLHAMKTLVSELGRRHRSDVPQNSVVVFSSPGVNIDDGWRSPQIN